MTRHPLIPILGALLAAATLSARAESIPEAYQRVAREGQVPVTVLYRLAQTVSHARLSDGASRPWPWTVTVDGRPHYFRDRASAVKALARLAAKSGARIQVGLMQLDWQRYRRHYALAPQALFDPWLNLRLAASELRNHYRDSGRWSLAAARYTGSLRARALPFQVNTRRRRELAPTIHAIATRHGLPPALIEAVIAAESNFNARAVSPAGARGLMQLMPATARRFGVSDPFDPAANIEGGARYLRWLLDEFTALTLALAGYNAGEGAVRKYGNAIPPYAETRKYVPRVLAFYRLFITEEATS